MRASIYWFGLWMAILTLLGACKPLRNAPAAYPAGVGAGDATPSPAADQPAVAPAPFISSLPDLGPAPELENDTWINVDQPLRLADLRGKVVLIDMWTFG